MGARSRPVYFPVLLGLGSIMGVDPGSFHSVRPIMPLNRSSFRIRTVLLLSLVGGAANPLAAQGEADDSVRALIREMLQRAPSLSDSSDLLRESAYTSQAIDFISNVAAPDSSTVAIRNSTEAIAFLERLLAPDSVWLRLESTPAGFPVTLRRISRPLAAPQALVTDTSLLVPAAVYLVEMFNTVSGETRLQQRVCTTDCRIRWRTR